MYLKKDKYKMALTLMKDADLKKGIVSVGSNGTIVSPAIKEIIGNSCSCKTNSCSRCVRNSLNEHLPNLITQNQMDYIALQAYLSESGVLKNGIFTRTTKQTDEVSSSDQVITQRSIRYKGRKKKKCVSDLSPLTSGCYEANNNNRENNNNSVNAKSSTKSKKFVCSICHDSFGYKHVLTNHVRTHTGEKPYKCNQCQRAFTRDHHLKIHERLHTGERPFECDQCGKRFVQSANLQRHLRVHTGERPYACDYCESKFSDLNQLKSHTQIHTGEKPFACDQCHGRFRKKHHIQKHKCLKNRVTPEKRYVDSEAVIKHEERNSIVEDELRNCSLSDHAASNDSGIVSVGANETIVSPVMKEPISNSYRYKTNSCNSICNSVNIHPLEFNLQNPITQNQLFPVGTGLMNHSELEAIFASSPVFRGMYAPEIFSHWQPSATYTEPPHVVSSSDQINNRQRSTPSKRRKKKELVSICSTPISPPISTSSPLTDGPSETDCNKRENNNDTENNNNHAKPSAKSKKYVCDVCHRSFDYKHVLQNHGRTHTGEKPFMCLKCSKRFTRDHHLKTHMRLHTGEKPYTCDHCQKKFVQVANLRRHIRVHTGERPYPCDECTSKFSDSNQLNAHKLIHSKQKPFACNQCNGRFRRKHHLKSHKCPKNCVATERTYVDSEAVIRRGEQDMTDEDEFRKCCSSDDAVSNDSGMSASSSISRMHHNGYYKPWAQSAHLSPLPEPLNLSPMATFSVKEEISANEEFSVKEEFSIKEEIPVQTDPVDLSMNRKYRSANNNNSSGSGSVGDSSRSISPMDETNSSPLME